MRGGRGRTGGGMLVGAIVRDVVWALGPKTSRRMSGECCSGVLEAVVAPEQLVAYSHGGHARYAALDRVLGGFLQAVLDRVALEGGQQGLWVELAGGARQQEVVHLVQAPAGVELLAEGGQRERGGSSDLGREGGRPHGVDRVGPPGPT